MQHQLDALLGLDSAESGEETTPEPLPTIEPEAPADEQAGAAPGDDEAQAKLAKLEATNAQWATYAEGLNEQVSQWQSYAQSLEAEKAALAEQQGSESVVDEKTRMEVAELQDLASAVPALKEELARLEALLEVGTNSVS